MAASWIQLPPDTALWMRLGDLWHWRPVDAPIESDIALLGQMQSEGWQQLDLEKHPLQAVLLWSQLSEIRQFKLPGTSTLQHWAHAEDIERAQAMPVVLAFTLPESAPREPAMLNVAEKLPPPQLGELAWIQDDQDNHRVLRLSNLGDDGLLLWRQLGKALTALAAPAEWWLFNEFTATCLQPGGYEARRSALQSELLNSRGAARERVRSLLGALNQAHNQVRQLQAAQQRTRDDPEQWQEQWQEIRGMAVELASLYWQAQQQAVSAPSVATIDDDPADASSTIIEPEDPENAADLALVESVNTVSSAQDMLLTNYPEDEAVRHAAFRANQQGEWSEDSGMLRFTHKSLGVYLGDPKHPMPLAEAQARLLQIRESTVLTMRIAMGLWNIRRYDRQLLKNGAAPVPIDEILQWRGIKKHSRLAHPELGNGPTNVKRRTDGWEAKYVDAVCEDFALAELFYVHGSHDIWKHGKRVGSFEISSPYMRATPVKRKDLWGHEEVVGMFVSPGDWINSFADNGNYFLTPADRRIFQLNPQNEQHELRIALYLVELWRRQAKDRAYSEPVTMADLLRESVIAVNEKNLTNRFAPRIEEALANLQRQGIIGSYECLTPVDKNKARWGKAWLAAHWRILPPHDVVDALEQIVHSGNVPKALPKPDQKRPRR